ncbi:MAG: hypothetical protein LBC61_01195 [Candidatus Peribacteria bacterium]|nr:hypothetical protein [Candidatus Peribacteria bacterium]
MVLLGESSLLLLVVVLPRTPRFSIISLIIAHARIAIASQVIAVIIVFFHFVLSLEVTGHKSNW